MRQVTRHMNPASDQLGPEGLVVGAEDGVWADQIRSKNAGINASQTAACDCHELMPRCRQQRF
jgi:hypothetical protein